jgi:hypothetical protein
MKIYHYTKSIKINSIFHDGFIATERKRSLSKSPPATDFVWFTEKRTYPKTALPYFSMFPETSLQVHIQRRNVFVDLDKIGSELGGFYRFGFESSNSLFKKWHFSQERKSASSGELFSVFERIANKVGDDTRSFWISATDVPLEGFSLEIFKGGHWEMLLENASISCLSEAERQVVSDHCLISRQKCIEFGLPTAVRNSLITNLNWRRFFGLSNRAA